MPSRSPSLAGIEGSGLREETSPEPRRGELKERRGGGEDGGGKNRSWSPIGAGGRIPQPTPPTPPSPRAPPAQRAASPCRPASLPGAVSHAPFVSETLRLWLSFCPSPLLPSDRRSGWNLPPSQIQTGSRPLHPEEPSPFRSRSLLLPHPKTTPLLPRGLERIIITLRALNFMEWAELIVSTTYVKWEGQSSRIPIAVMKKLRLREAP